MSNSNVNIEKSSKEKLSSTVSIIIFKMELKSILNHLSKTYFIYMKNIIRIRNNEISGLDSVTSDYVVCILLRTAKYKLDILNNFLRPNYAINYAINYAYKRKLNSNTEILFVNAEDIPSAFLNRELVLFEMIVEFRRKVTDESKYKLINILNEIIETWYQTIIYDLRTLNKLCQP
ncbi:hypothetical protein CWI39_0232p0030 [Hamiltosporidium magnivora]|uniref:Uncharacterized protein n=1 Tax=Hamiltosporidium magnivora TaxID=148818 RepID=A0A4Q9LLM7_9MICR|nr:hypothetical protein CWI39_0232p0030 [Hamiltosporidium magnivora]